jgi:hypothetical protein
MIKMTDLDKAIETIERTSKQVSWVKTFIFIVCLIILLLLGAQIDAWYEARELGLHDYSYWGVESYTPQKMFNEGE